MSAQKKKSRRGEGALVRPSGEYSPLHDKGIKEIENKSMETTNFEFAKLLRDFASREFAKCKILHYNGDLNN